MVATLPRLKVQAIPTGQNGAPAAAAADQDPVGSLLGNTTGLSQGADQDDQSDPGAARGDSDPYGDRRPSPAPAAPPPY